MNPAELRIGNLVVIELLGEEHEIQIGQIAPDEIKEAYFNEWRDIEDLKPIPLSSEWLERLGFKHNSLGVSIKIKDRQFWVDNANKKRWWLTEEKTGKTIDLTGTVHNLQNVIFDLTGEELTIKEKAA